jgi:hypothetical protein
MLGPGKVFEDGPRGPWRKTRTFVYNLLEVGCMFFAGHFGGRVLGLRPRSAGQIIVKQGSREFLEGAGSAAVGKLIIADGTERDGRKMGRSTCKLVVTMYPCRYCRLVQRKVFALVGSELVEAAGASKKAAPSRL